jgi:hypothetical protein
MIRAHAAWPIAVLLAERQNASEARMDALERRVSKLEDRAGPE